MPANRTRRLRSPLEQFPFEGEERLRTFGGERGNIRGITRRRIKYLFRGNSLGAAFIDRIVEDLSRDKGNDRDNCGTYRGERKKAPRRVKITGAGKLLQRPGKRSRTSGAIHRTDTKYCALSAGFCTRASFDRGCTAKGWHGSVVGGVTEDKGRGQRESGVAGANGAV